MASLHQALVRITIPQLDPDDDPVSISLAYESQVPLGGPSDTGGLRDNVPKFLNVAAALSANYTAFYLSPSLDRGANHARIDIYDIGPHLDGTPHGSPVDSGTFTLGAAGTLNALPSGVAATVSFRADYGTDVKFGAPTGVETGRLRPRSRDRGRFYLGPLSTNAVFAPAPTYRCRLTPALVFDALENLQQVAFISDVVTYVWKLGVWSRKNATIKGVTELWMDDRPDYQRRRSDPGLKTFRAA